MATRKQRKATRPGTRRVRVVLLVDPRTGGAVEEGARVRDRRGRWSTPVEVVRYVTRPASESEARARQYARQAARSAVVREWDEYEIEEPQVRRPTIPRPKVPPAPVEPARPLRRRAPDGRYIRAEPAVVASEPPAKPHVAPARVERPKRAERLRDAAGHFASVEQVVKASPMLADRWRQFLRRSLGEIGERLGVEGYASKIRSATNSDNSVDVQITVPLPKGEDPREVLRLLEGMRNRNLWPENAPGAFISVGVQASDRRSDSAALKRSRGLPAWSHPIDVSRTPEAFLTARGATVSGAPIGIVPNIENHMSKSGRFEAVTVRLHWSPIGKKPDRPSTKRP